MEIDVVTSCNTPKLLTAFSFMLLFVRLCLMGFRETVNTQQQKNALPRKQTCGSIGAGHLSQLRTLQSGPAVAGISGAGGKGTEGEESIAIQGRAECSF
ncbi:hypothetical protein GR247_38550 [Rhizobium leguminosarum]|uniref:Uncharacterized protein n=1 Tax=Rhizobium leguminosarum TaxID=384 RepID=A0A6P0C4G9_RHILE|nr:hypothetical protein [Rhizobium leguminosarum]MBY5325546.1 hypothetical protein [Rhizobium leguminosarum]NEI96187.1 hypothetical protein [Rhizobium leguminosarum]NEJ25918.1 hypothetical protein [Rhizobium leguminosarum]NEJ82080.1 hypothetical protein [Rhizobium leguminosarum]NEK54771.1 hypothetical protein [Rhizobium leguminosarum]